MQDIIQKLSESHTKDYTSIFEEFCFNKNLFLKYQSWSTEKYTRNCIYNDVNYELILLCWEKDQGTAVHCHGGEECWVYLLEGELTEVLFDKHKNNTITQKEERKLQKHQSSYINDEIGLHKLKNSFKGRSVSLHLYAKPIEKCTVYDVEISEFITRKLKYDTLNEELQLAEIVN